MKKVAYPFDFVPVAREQAGRALVFMLIPFLQETKRAMQRGDLQKLDLQMWRSEAGSRLWLSRLIAAMEDASRPELRQRSVEAQTACQLLAQLALPASLRFQQAPSQRH